MEIRCGHVPSGEMDILAWLKRQSHYPKFFWANRDHSEIGACCGSVLTLRPSLYCSHSNVYSRIRSILRKNPEVVFFGGAAFNPGQRPTAQWRSFGSFFYFIPRYIVEKKGGRTTQITYSCDGEKNEFPSFDVDRPLEFQGDRKAWFEENHPKREEWEQLVARVLKEIDSHRYQKLVLARETRYWLSQNSYPEDMLRIFKQPSNTHDFYFQPERDSAFLGRSPELLFKRMNRELYSEAVAGSLALEGHDPGEKQRVLAFLQDEKSRQEHAYVMNYLLHSFGSLCSQISEPSEVTTIPLDGLLHLYSGLRGVLKSTIQDEHILSCLHPTPAVGGYPKGVARKALSRLEPFHRGWYAGTIGRISQEKTEMAVGIRSMLQRKKSICLYAGAGIILQSDSGQEWSELDQKILPFRSRLNA